MGTYILTILMRGIGGLSMNIIISPKAKEQLSIMGKNTMTIYTEAVSSCWSPRAEIFVKLKEPEALEKYNMYEVDGIKVYLYKEAIPSGDTIEIAPAKYSSDLANKEFDVYGLELE